MNILIREYLDAGVVQLLKWMSNDHAQCPTAPFAVSVACGSKYDQSFVAYQLIIRLSSCGAFNDVNSFLLYGYLPELETVVSSPVAEAV